MSLMRFKKLIQVRCLEMQDDCFPPRIQLLKEMAIYLNSKRDPEKARPVGHNWHLSFLERHPELRIKYSRQIEYVQVEAQEDYFVFVNFFERVCIIISNKFMYIIANLKSWKLQL